MGDGGSTVTTLFGSLDASTFEGVMDGVIELIPVMIPVLVGIIAIRKGIGFIRSVLR